MKIETKRRTKLVSLLFLSLFFVGSFLVSDNFALASTNVGCADIDANGVVGYTDLGMVSSAMNTCSGNIKYNAKYDISGDNCINQADIDIIQANYGKNTTCAQATSCPDIKPDNVINYLDLAIIGQIYNSCIGDSNYDIKIDLNGDGCINNAELIIIENFYNVDASTIPACIIKKSPCSSFGDIDDDDFITPLDRDLALQYSVGNITFTDIQKLRADVNRDGQINSVDSLIIGQFVSGSITTFPVCTEKFIKVISPNGGEEFEIGQEIEIVFINLLTEGNSVLITDHLGTSYVVGSTSGDIDNSIQRIDWEIPSDVALGEYKVRVRAVSNLNHFVAGEDESDNYFSITNNNTSPCSSYGDLDDDGYVTDIDGTMAADGLSGKIILSESAKSRADVNYNGGLDIGDVAAINSFVAGSITTFPVCATKSVKVISPNGGEIVNNEKEILWSTSNLDSGVCSIYLYNAIGTEQIIKNIMLNQSSSYTRYQWNLTSDTDGRYKIGVHCSEYGNSAVYSDKSDNYFSIVRSGEALPDLIVESIRIDAYHNIIVKIKNVGTALYDASLSYDSAFISWKDLTSEKAGSIKNYRIANIPAGGSEEFILTKNIITEGEHNLEITVDPDNIVEESNENNNTSNLSIVISENNLPDLVITGFEVKKVVDPHLGEGIDILVKIKNIGEGYYINSDSRVPNFVSWMDLVSGKSGSIGNYKLISILPGETQEYSICRTGIDLDSYKIKVTVDPDNIIEESNNLNNILIKDSDRYQCLIDGTLVKLPDDPKIYVIINCKRYWVKTAEEFQRKGYNWGNVKIFSDEEINSIPENSEEVVDINEGSMIRVAGTDDVYIVKYIGNKKFKRLILNPTVFASYGHLRWEDIVDTERSIVDSFVTSNLVRSAETGRIYRLDANGDMGTRRHFGSMSLIQNMGYDLEAIYEINKEDENAYNQGDDM